MTYPSTTQSVAELVDEMRQNLICTLCLINRDWEQCKLEKAFCPWLHQPVRARVRS